MKIKSAEFETSAKSLDTCPKPSVPELAFIGRSNVGKSSLINMLSGRRGQLAKVSGTPGKTRLINFFMINNNWRLVDLPGYGYAKLSKKARSIFRDFVSEYMTERENLLGTLVLIDSRLSPQDIDLDYITWLAEMNVPFALVFTKADKLSKTAVTKSTDKFFSALDQRIDGRPDHFVTSAKNGSGKAELLNYIGENLKNSP